MATDTATEVETELDWPAVARLCKGPVRPDVRELRFRWGPTDHVLRRLLGTDSLPELRQLSVSLMWATDGPLRLFRGLALAGRPLERLRMTIAADPAGRRHVTLDLQLARDGSEVVVAPPGMSDVGADEIRALAAEFNLADFMIPP